MTKIKIAAVIVCMLATGAFAGFTYQAANHSGNSDEGKVTVREVSEEETFADTTVTDEETTDEEVTDEEITAEELTAEETVPAVTTAKKKEADKERAVIKLTEASTSKKEKEPEISTMKKVAAAPVVTTAPTVKETPETSTEQQTAAPVIEETPVYTEPEVIYTEPVVEETPVEEKHEEAPAVQETETEAPAEEPVNEEPAEEETEEESGRKVYVTDEEYIWLCNVVGHEYGSDWISEYEKAKVVEVIMNRVNDSRFPNSIWGVLTQPYQFSGLEWTLYLGTYSYQVTPSVKAAVDLYLEHPEDFQHGYLAFWGDGSMNHFYSI